MALPPILIPVKPQNAIWLYSSRVVEVEAGFRLFTQASGQMSVHDNVWGRLALPALSLSTNEMVLMLLGRKAMTIEAFDGLLFASCYFGTTPGCLRFSEGHPSSFLCHPSLPCIPQRANVSALPPTIAASFAWLGSWQLPTYLHAQRHYPRLAFVLLLC